jgi:hypothetical protein
MAGSGAEGDPDGEKTVDNSRPEFLMVRFFDFIKPGKKYVYRVQVVLEDPNRPKDAIRTPHQRTLHDTVRKRLTTVLAHEQRTRKRYYYRATEWSEPTAPVSAPTGKVETYAGPVNQPPMQAIPYGEGQGKKGPSGFAISDNAPKAKVMSITWNDVLSIDVPAIVSASRGDYLNFKQSADVIHPVTLEYKTIEDFDLKTKQLIVDVRGGVVLPDCEANDILHSPGEFAAIDTDGSLFVRNELDSWQTFDLFAPPVKRVLQEE